VRLNIGDASRRPLDSGFFSRKLSEKTGCAWNERGVVHRMEWMEWDEALARNRHPPYDGPFVESWDNRWLSID